MAKKKSTEFPTLKALNDSEESPQLIDPVVEELPATDIVVEVTGPKLDVKELAKSIKNEFRKVESKVLQPVTRPGAPGEVIRAQGAAR